MVPRTCRKDAFGLRSLLFPYYSSSIMIMAVICLIRLSQATTNEMMLRAYAERFRDITREEHLELWHTDCHRRCREQLIDHIHLACNNDPYRILKKRSVSDDTPAPAHQENHSEQIDSLFMNRHVAASFLASGHKTKQHGHKIVKRGVMEECCYSKSCSWEEYAEFCHGHNRRANDRTSTCLR